MLADGKGILAADESFPTIGKRFKELGIPSTEDTRRAYREMLFTTSGLGESISGAILFDETIRQKTSDGRKMTEVLESQGIVPGIKVDEGAVDMPGFPDEKMTSGLDKLRERLAEYRALGARFTKWRAVIGIGSNIPTSGCIETNAESLAVFAGLCQEAGLVPIVEPEVLMDGNHTIARCEQVVEETLSTVFRKLRQHRVSFETMILKSSMVLSGEDCPLQASDAEIAKATVRCFRRSVPAAVPGIVFLSGGQPDIPATRRLNEINRTPHLPWRLTFSYGRALQDAAMKAWGGKAENVAAGQQAIGKRARLNGLAAKGAYADGMEK